MDSLRLTVVTPHHASLGCKCRACYGLAEYMHDLTGRDHGLQRTEAPLVPVPAPLSATEPCTGAMTCGCPDCEHERSERLKAGPKRIRQPWESKAA